MNTAVKVVLSGVGGLVLGAGAILGIRFATYHPARVHYHANFSVYINGQRELFKGPGYYEEEGGSSCDADTKMTPMERAHLHDNVNDVIHVHDNAVTWGQFFENLHWSIGDGFIKTPTQIYLADDTHHVSFLINGHPLQDASNEIIKDQDRLLVDYGDTTDSTLNKEMNSVAKTALQEDLGKDPAACQAGAAPTFSERMKHLF